MGFEFSIGFVLSAFVAGLLTFLAPCTLPLVPGYLGFISGVSPKELEDEATAKAARRKIIINGLFFVFGFSVVFIIFGALFGSLTQILELLGFDLSTQAQGTIRTWLSRIGGVFVILFGLFMLGILKLPFLNKEKRMRMPKWLEVGRPSSSLIIGGAFAFGWTPCVGPILGSILLVAASEGTVLMGAFLLFVFSMGLAVPFILIAFGFSHATQYINALTKYLKWVSIIGGLLLIFLGYLLVTGDFGLLNAFFFRFFGDYEEFLLDYL